MRSIPKGLSEIPQVPTYSPIGLAMNFEYFPIEPGKEIEVPLPFTNTQITNGTECFMVIRKNDSCDIVHPTSVNLGYLTVTVDSTVKSVILIQKTMSFGSSVAYLDGGMIYSQDNGTSISTNIVLRNCQPEYVNGALMKVFYTDISDPFNPVNDSVLFPLDTIKENGSYLLKNSDIVHLAGAIRVTAIIVDVPQCSVSNIDSTMHNISRGQNLVLNCNRSINNLGSIEKPVSASYEISYALESVSIDGEGRILQHRTGDSVTYSYDYYLKDHLGSTRMVINDQNSITEKVAYQSYGTINPLDSSSPALPSREKFTGKEFDTQGADFARVEFDIAVREFDMSSGSGFIRVSYKDVATGNDFSKIYMARYDSRERSLRFTGSESFTGEVEIEQMFLIASGAPGGIFNIVPIDSFLVSLGKTRKIQLDVASSEIVSAPIDTNFYIVHTAVDNSSYFSGTRLFYFGARYYDPELGIWLSVDPASQFANAYGYANNPIIMVDPDGNYFLIDDLIAIVGGAIVGGITAGLSGNNVWAGMGIGAAIGESSLYTAGATAGALGGGLAGAAVGGAVGGVMASTLNTGLLSGSSGIGTGWGNISGGQIGMAALGGAIGGIASFGGSAISDRLVSAADMGKWGSVATEIGISGAMGAASSAATQGLSIGFGWQKEFSGASMGISAAAAAGMAGFRIASRGYLRNSMSAAKEHFEGYDDALERYKKHLPDPFKNRIKQYREGAWFGVSSKDCGDAVFGKWVSYYKGGMYTFAHEASHYYGLTMDKTYYKNAYSFESWVGDYQIYDSDLDVNWNRGVPSSNPFNEEIYNW
jgi:RHS repeat-associated protein